MRNERVERYRADGEPRIVDRVVEQNRALVYSVCRRYLRNPADVEDAAQETFMKLAAHIDGIHGQIGGWLAATASSTCIDIIRRSTSEQRRQKTLGRLGPASTEHQLCHQAIGQRLQEGLLVLDETSRQLIIERFFQKTALRVIAAGRNVSVATMSRRVHRALGDLAAVLRDMGIESADDLTLAEHFGEAGNRPEWSDAGECGLRFAPDWRAVAAGPWGEQALKVEAPRLPGWSRPVRVGVFVGYRSAMTPGYRGVRQEIEEQVWSTRLMAHPGLQLVAIVEPGTTQHGMIEGTLRDYDLTGGLIDSTDLQGLDTLDAIFLGINWALSPGTAKAFVEAAHRGVGLYNEYWTGLYNAYWTDLDQECYDSEHTRQLMLADSKAYAFHTAPLLGQSCGRLLPATVHQAHPALPGLTAGMSFLTRGCGPVYQVRKEATVLVSKEHVVAPEEHRIAGLGPARMPVCIAGQLGGGRVLVANIAWPGTQTPVPGLRNGFMIDLLTWLAEPRRNRAIAR